MNTTDKKIAPPDAGSATNQSSRENPTTRRADEQAAQPAKQSGPHPYTTRGWAELAKMELPALVNVWGWFIMGAIAVIFGQGGLGKSRVALNIARNQVLGLPFAGLPTWREPLRHLFMGSENSIHRLQRDVQKMSQGLGEDDLALLESHIHLATLEQPADCFISVATAANIAKWRTTLEAWPPDVLWIDPWGDVLDGEANSDEDTRQTLMILRQLLRQANPAALMVILAHARTGAKNILQAVGFDAANFGKGSKALYSAARCVWNLAPGDESENPPLVMAHGKSNDGPREKPRALILDPETMLYHLDHDFDFDSWQEEVNARANGKGRPRRRARMTEDEAFSTLGDRAETKTEAQQILREAGATRDEAADLMKRLLIAGKWTEYRPPFQHTAVYVGPPAAVSHRKAEILEAAQGKIAL